MMFDLLQIPVRILRTVILGHEASAELAHINASTQRWLDEQPVTAAQPDTGLRAEVDHLRFMLAEADQITRSLVECTRQRDAARRGIKGLSEHLVAGHVTLGKANAEIERLRADVVRLTTAHDALDDAALASAETLKRLREDLADARNQLPATLGQTVTLRFEDGGTLTGPLYLDVSDQRTVRGFHADRHGRSVVVVPDGGA